MKITSLSSHSYNYCQEKMYFPNDEIMYSQTPGLKIGEYIIQTICFTVVINRLCCCLYRDLECYYNIIPSYKSFEKNMQKQLLTILSYFPWKLYNICPYLCFYVSSHTLQKDISLINSNTLR